MMIADTVMFYSRGHPPLQKKKGKNIQIKVENVTEENKYQFLSKKKNFITYLCGKYLFEIISQNVERMRAHLFKWFLPR